MKLLILGGQGMAGHMLVQYFTRIPSYSVWFTTRDNKDPQGLYMDVRDHLTAEKLLEAVSPDIVINCVGLLNDDAGRNELDAYQINGIFPHFLKKLADKLSFKLIQISTDCVFLGDRGSYAENDALDGTTVYAKSKAMGEIKGENCLTIRTSIVGPEIRKQGIGLFKWFMQQEGTVKGYKKVLWNGITTLELAKAIHYIVEHSFCGILHLCSPKKISKFELLHLFQKIYHKNNVRIVPDEVTRLDRTITNTRSDFTYAVPGYEEMLHELDNWMRSS